MLNVHNAPMDHRRRRPDPWVGAWLRGLRKASDITPEVIAEKLKRDPSWLSRIETGVSSISADDMPAVLAAYGVSTSRYAREVDKRRASKAAA